MDGGFAPRIPIRTAVRTFPLAQANQVLAMLKRAEIQGAAAERSGFFDRGLLAHRPSR